MPWIHIPNAQWDTNGMFLIPAPYHGPKRHIKHDKGKAHGKVIMRACSLAVAKAKAETAGDGDNMPADNTATETAGDGDNMPADDTATETAGDGDNMPAIDDAATETAGDDMDTEEIKTPYDYIKIIKEAGKKLDQDLKIWNESGVQ